MTPQNKPVDFRAIMSRPLQVSGIRQIKSLSAEDIKTLVRNHHPASKCAAQHKPVLVK